MPLCIPQPAAPPLSGRAPVAYGPRAAAEERAGGETAKWEASAENASAGGGGVIDLKRWMEQRVRATGIEPFPSLHGAFPPPLSAHSPESPPEYLDSGWIREPPRGREGREGKEGREVRQGRVGREGKEGKEGKEGRQAKGAKEARELPARPQVAKRAGRGASSKFARLSHAEWEAQAMAMVAQKKRLLLAARSRDERGGAGKEREKKDRRAAGGGKEAGSGVAGRASGAGGARERESGARHVQLLPPPQLSARPAGEDGGESEVEGGRGESSAAATPRPSALPLPQHLVSSAAAPPLSPAGSREAAEEGRLLGGGAGGARGEGTGEGMVGEAGERDEEQGESSSMVHVWAGGHRLRDWQGRSGARGDEEGHARRSEGMSDGGSGESSGGMTSSSEGEGWHASALMQLGGVAGGAVRVTEPASRREAVRRGRQAALVACLLEEGFRPPDLLRFASTRRALLTTSPTLAQERMAYLRAIGLPAADVPRLVARCPKLLTYRVDTRMAPRVDFLMALGVPPDRVARVIQLAPGIFECSVDRAIRPRIRFLQNALQLSDEDVVKVVLRSPQVLTQSVQSGLVPRLHYFLHDLALPLPSLASMVVRHPQLLHYSLDDAVRPRVAFLRSIGLSSRDVAHVLFRLPQILSLSVPNCLAPKYDYLIHHLGGSPNSIVSFPAYFSLSLHARIRPRHLFYLHCRAASAPTDAPPQLLSSLSLPPAHDPSASPRAATSSSPATPTSLPALPLPTDASLMPPPPAPHPAQPAHPFAFLSSARPFSEPSSPPPPPQAPLPSTAFPLSLLTPTDEAFCRRLGLPNDREYQAFKLALTSSAAPTPQATQAPLVHASAALLSAEVQPAAGVLRRGKGGPVSHLTSPAGGESTRESTVQGS
ncbi:unnamed protein product [Closterium sp. NIES-64]|nr:unnamed protein product [Closterium sp. NIES-65]CAI5994557.1 unnamed protein product [Closterium sp. NIES-64]